MATLEASTQHLIELADQYSISEAIGQSKITAVAEGHVLDTVETEEVTNGSK